jgi:hypothetical protein
MGVIETKSQAVLNTKQNINPRIHLKNGRSAGTSAYARKGTISRVTVASRPKVSFDQTAAPVPEIMDGPSHIIYITYLQIMITMTTYDDNDDYVYDDSFHDNDDDAFGSKGPLNNTEFEWIF